MSRKRVFGNGPIRFILMVTVAVFLLFTTISTGFGGRYGLRCTELTDGWTVTYRGETYEDTEYGTFLQIYGSSFDRGDTILCERVMDPYNEPAFPALLIRSRQSAIEVSVGGEVIYNADEDILNNRGFIGRRVRFVTLPNDYAGQELTIKISPGRGNYAAGYRAPFFGDYRDLFRMYIDNALPALCTGIFLFLFGWTYLFIALHFSMGTDRRMQIISAVICVDMGLWILCYFDLLQLFARDIHSTELEYICFYMLMPLLYLFIARLNNLRPLLFIGWGFIAAVFVAFVLHVGGIMFISEPVTVYHGICLVSLILIIILFFRKRVFKKGEREVDVRELGMLIMVIFMTMYLLSFLVESSLGMTAGYVAIQMPCIGMLSFAALQILYYYLNVSETYAKRREFEKLSEMAYVDMLTGLPNRKAADNALTQLNHTDADYCILSLDVNGLKTVNDTMGHAEGDRLLCNMADILNRSFREGSFRARLSGDEFIVVLQDVKVSHVKESLERMHHLLCALNRKEPQYYHSISCGCAFRGETESGDSQDVYKLADDRMYEAKRRYYSEAEMVRKEARAI